MTMLTPFTYAGSKRKEIKSLQRFFPLSPLERGTIVEPFAGTGIVSGVYAKTSHLNDLNKDIAQFWKLVKTNRKELFGLLDFIMKEEHRDETFYYQMREMYNEFWRKDEWPIGRTAYFYYLVMSSHAGMVRYSSRGFNASYKKQLGFKTYNFENRKKSIVEIADKTATVYSMDAILYVKTKMASKEPVVFYCDPPYVKSGIEYGQEWNFDKLMELDDLLMYATTLGHRAIMQNYSHEVFLEKSKADEHISKTTARRVSNWQSVKTDIISLYGEFPNAVDQKIHTLEL